MAETLTGTIQNTTACTIQNAVSFGTTALANPGRTFQFSLNSTDITKCYFNTYTVTSAATAVDLTNLTDVFGVALNFAAVKHLLVWNHDTANGLTVGGGTSALFPALPVLAGQSANSGSTGSCLSLTTSLAVTTSASRVIQLQGPATSAAALSVDFFVMGA